jgi:hypothetical protein
MRRLQFLLFVLIVSALGAYGQMIENFDTATPTAAFARSSESPTVFTLSFDPADKVEGDGSMRAYAALASVHSWGTYAQVGYQIPDGQPVWDWSINDSISVWIKVKSAPVLPGNIVFRINIADRPTPSDAAERWIYENATILDNLNTGWVNLRVPLIERVQPPSNDLAPDSTGFIPAPGGWNLPRNNSKFDRDKIVGWYFDIVSTTIDADSLVVSYDKFERFGVRPVPAIVFNGKAFDGHITNVWGWGQSSVSVEQNAGPVPNSNAVKWIQGDEYGNGWTGWGTDIDPRYNLSGAWNKDSLKLSLKVESGVGPFRAQFESGGDGKMGIVFTPVTDNQWHEYSLALADFVPQDATTNFNPASIGTFGLMAEASGIAGKVIYVGKIWTGNPEIDVIPPSAPTGLAVSGANYSNLITWNDVPNEPGVHYNAFFSDHAWTSVGDSTVEDVPPYNLVSAFTDHRLRAPNTDQDVTYYYGVIAKDGAGNESSPVIATSPVTSLAKGVPTFSTTPPTFVANGSLSEWTGITPFILSVESGTAHGVQIHPISGDADLLVKAYLAVDAQYLYVAFDVQDDTVAVDTSASATDYQQDCPDLILGAYDWRGKHHTGYRRGATPDYHFRFSKNRIKLDQNNNPVLEYATPGNPNYVWKEKTLTSGYVVEARISWTALASAITGGNDAVFVPQEGMRIAMNLVINDRDDIAPGGTRNAGGGIMDYSPLSNDNSWSDMYYWTHTWIGNKWTVDVRQTSDVPQSFSLQQNYPNPFNPTTQITYSLQKQGLVSLRVYDVIGREVATLVNSNQEPGSYTVTFNPSQMGQNLSSGVYIYRLEAGPFAAVHKMMLLK